MDKQLTDMPPEAGTRDLGADRGATATTGPDTANETEIATETGSGSEIGTGTAEHPAIETVTVTVTVTETETETASALEETTVGIATTIETETETEIAASDETAVCPLAASDTAAGAAVGVEVDEEVHWGKWSSANIPCLTHVLFSFSFFKPSSCVCGHLVFVTA